MSAVGNENESADGAPVPRKRRNSTIAEPDKHFVCNHPGCDKAFVRSDHLSRHKLNHEPSQIFSCDRCPRTFVRPDLLKRHAERHDKRELNGFQSQPKPGRIKGATNKKKLSLTTLPPKAPQPPPPPSATRAKDSTSAPTSSSQTPIPLPPTLPTVQDAYDHDRYTDLLAPQPPRSPSPASSAHLLLDFSFLGGASNGSPAGLGSPENPQNLNLSTNFDSVLMDASNLGAWPSDTPFLSSTEAHWLFSNIPSSGPPGPPVNQTSFSNGNTHQNHNNFALQGSALQTLQNLQNVHLNDPISKIPPSINISAAHNNIQHHHLNGPPPQNNIHLRNGEVDQLPKALQALAKQSQPLPTVPEVLGAPKALEINEQSRMRMLDYLPSEFGTLKTDPLCSPSSLTDYLDRFFEWDRTHYSMMHRPTFEVNESPAHLLWAMVGIGCYFTSAEAHAMASEIYSYSSKALLHSPDFRAPAPLHIVQAGLLLNVFGRTMSTAQEHDSAHILYPSLVTLARRSGLFHPRPVAVSRNADITAKWLAWKEEELAKRTAFMAYQFDIMCYALFKETATLSAFQIKLNLPSNEEEWWASTAREWHRLHSRNPAPVSFLATLKSFLMPGLNAPEMSAVARVVCLYGLLSVCFDMQWRENFLLGLSTHPDGLVKEWRLTLTSAYNCWKSRFDVALTSAPTAYGTQLLRNAISIYAIAHCTLSVDIDELQIFAGAKKAFSQPVLPQSVDATRRRIISWSGTKGKEAAWHAAHFLRSGILNRHPIENCAVHSQFHDWCLYLACLCIYAYGTAVSVANNRLDEDRYEDPLTYLDAICSVSPDFLNSANIGNSLGVCEVVADILRENTKWEMASEAADLLDRLVSFSGGGGQDG